MYHENVVTNSNTTLSDSLSEITKTIMQIIVCLAQINILDFLMYSQNFPNMVMYVEKTNDKFK